MMAESELRRTPNDGIGNELGGGEFSKAAPAQCVVRSGFSGVALLLIKRDKNHSDSLSMSNSKLANIHLGRPFELLVCWVAFEDSTILDVDFLPG